MDVKFIGNFTEAMKNAFYDKSYKIEKLENENNKLSGALKVSNKDKKGKFKVELDLRKYRASSIGKDYYTLVNKVIKQIVNQIKSQKSREEYRVKNWDRSQIKITENDKNIGFTHTLNGLFTKEKELHVDTMSDVTALDMIQNLDHIFFIYKSKDRNCICIIYKRYDDSYGILEVV